MGFDKDAVIRFEHGIINETTMMIDKKTMINRTISIDKKELVIILRSVPPYSSVPEQSDDTLFGNFVLMLNIFPEQAEGYLFNALIWHSALESNKQSEDSEDLPIVHEVRRWVLSNKSQVASWTYDETILTVEIESTKETTEVIHP